MSAQTEAERLQQVRDEEQAATRTGRGRSPYNPAVIGPHRVYPPFEPGRALMDGVDRICLDVAGQRQDSARWLTMSTMEIERDRALMASKGLAGSESYRISGECVEMVHEREKGKGYDRARVGAVL